MSSGSSASASGSSDSWAHAQQGSFPVCAGQVAIPGAVEHTHTNAGLGCRQHTGAVGNVCPCRGLCTLRICVCSLRFGPQAKEHLSAGLASAAAVGGFTVPYTADLAGACCRTMLSCCGAVGSRREGGYDEGSGSGVFENTTPFGPKLYQSNVAADQGGTVCTSLLSLGECAHV